MKKRYYYYISGFILIIVAYLYFFSDEDSSTNIIIKPEFGKFVVSVTTTGELQSSKSIEIKGPSEARSIGIYQMSISKLVDEGTVVKEGDFVAELDKSQIASKIMEAQLELQKIESEYLQAKLDTTLSLSSDRDNLENLKYAMEENKLQIELSQYEAPAIKRQAEINYDRSERTYYQALKNYDTKVEQAKAKLSAVGADLSKQRNLLNKLLETQNEFTIRAPSEGMVIYSREWNGNRVVVGSTISPWNPVVANLPDLTQMESKTYVNEVDIQKIKEGQIAKIGLDADPGKKLNGKVIKVANIGEQKKNSDSKVFEVLITINEKDTTLLPSMTTVNEIIIEAVDSTMFIPLECIHSEEIKNERIPYVYKANGTGFVRQEVEIGLVNENHAEIKKGITMEDEILMSDPGIEFKDEIIRLKTNSKEK